jgi:hypothetical protein
MSPPLTEEQIDEIAERAAEKAVTKVIDHFYAEVGKGVVRKVLWVIGVGSIALFVWLAGSGHIKG